MGAGAWRRRWRSGSTIVSIWQRDGYLVRLGEHQGIFERLSAFSLEDLTRTWWGRLAAGIVMNHESESRSAYERTMNAWTREALRRLRGAAGRWPAGDAGGRGRGGTPSSGSPDNKLVLRRNLETASPLNGWLVADAVAKGPVHDELKQMCAKKPAPLPLSVPERLGRPEDRRADNARV